MAQKIERIVDIGEHGLNRETVFRESDNQGNEAGPYYVALSTQVSSVREIDYVNAAVIDISGEDPEVTSEHVKIQPGQTVKAIGRFQIPD